ncbi:MAG: YkgJ family cysteine cluster protein [Verrucomicrobiota bacterium]
MSSSIHSEDAATGQLCPACGLCCNGVIFANIALRPGDDAARLRSLGLPVCAPRSKLRPPHLAQPCAAFDGRGCRVYADRPQYCREFECVLLKSVQAGRTEPAPALRIIRTARDRADKVRRLLCALGDTDEQVPLSARFRRTGQRLKERDLDEETADLYAQLTLAVHDLNLLLSDAFYPGSPLHEPKTAPVRTAAALICAAVILFIAPGRLQADQIDMQNGDHYVGHVLSVNTNLVVLQSDVLGTLRLPRAKVTAITLDAGSATNSSRLPLPANGQVRAPSAMPTNAAPNLSPALRQLGSSTNLIQQVQKQFLSGAGPEANDKFNELLGGLISGKLTVDDIRAQAQSAADQLRALKREGGEEAGFAADAYLAILDHFLKETAPSASATNAPATSPKSTPAPAQPDE